MALTSSASVSPQRDGPVTRTPRAAAAVKAWAPVPGSLCQAYFFSIPCCVDLVLSRLRPLTCDARNLCTFPSHFRQFPLYKGIIFFFQNPRRGTGGLWFVELLGDTQAYRVPSDV